MTEPTAKLAEFAAGLRHQDMPDDVVLSTKMLLLDALACALAGHRGEETGQLRAVAQAFAPGAEDSSVIGGGRLSLAGATLFNGYLVTAVTMCDVHRATMTHITPEIAPPALAIAERDDVSGDALLAAIAAGCEVSTRIGIGLDYPVFRQHGWHGPGVLGPFGGAAAVGRLRGFDASAMARAFGLAGSQAAGTYAAWGTPTVKFHQCRAALSGLMAGLLAEEGFVATEDFLTSPDGGLYNTYAEGGLPEAVTGDLGARWELQRIALRLWPAATSLQDVLTALYNLTQSHDVPYADIEQVTLTLGSTPVQMHGGFSTYKAKFEALLSAHYVTSVYLRDRKLTLDQFEPACYDDPELRRFAAERVSVVADDAMAGGQARAELTTKSGRTVTGECVHPLGTPELPLSQAQVEDKFRTYAADVLPPQKLDDALQAVLELEHLKSARELMRALDPDD